MYAVVAPGFSSVYTNWKEVERVRVFYPYVKWAKCFSEQEAYEFIKRNSSDHVVKQLYNYGSTLDDLFIDVSYKIGNGCVYYTINTRKVGDIHLMSNEALIEYKYPKIFVKILNIQLSAKTIDSHMSAIYQLLNLIGENIDINLKLPNFSIYYALTAYSGTKNRTISIVRNKIKARLCEVAYTLELRSYTDTLQEV